MDLPPEKSPGSLWLFAWPRASHVTALCLGFLSCKIESVKPRIMWGLYSQCWWSASRPEHQKCCRTCGDVGQGRTRQHVFFPLSPHSSAETGRQADLKLGFSRKTSTTHSRCHTKLLGVLFSVPWNAPLSLCKAFGEVTWEARDLSQSCFEVGESRDGKSTWVTRCIPKSSCHRQPRVLFSHPKPRLVGNLPKKGFAHPRPSQSGTLDRNNGLSFSIKNYIFC